MTKCPYCGAEFFAPISEGDKLQIELELLKKQAEAGDIHPEIHEDDEHPLRDSHLNPNTGSSPFGMEG